MLKIAATSIRRSFACLAAAYLYPGASSTRRVRDVSAPERARSVRYVLRGGVSLPDKRGKTVLKPLDATVGHWSEAEAHEEV